MQNEPESNYSWNERMAASICSSATLSESMVEGILEAAGEMKCVRLKVLLARCQEVMEAFCDDSDQQPLSDMVDEIREALK